MTTTAPAAPRPTREVTLEVTRLGEAFWDGEPVTATELEARLARLKQDGGAVAYHRESPEQEPTAAQMAAIEAIARHKLPVRLGGGQRAGAATPLVWFEMQECPLEFRFAVVPRQPLLFAARADAASKVVTYLMDASSNADVVRRLMAQLDMLLATNRVAETPQRDAARVFAKDAVATPSVHLRFAHADGRRWQSTWPLAELPPNVRAFYDGCRRLGLDTVAAIQTRQVTAAAALGMVDRRHPWWQFWRR